MTCVEEKWFFPRTDIPFVLLLAYRIVSSNVNHEIPTHMSSIHSLALVKSFVSCSIKSLLGQVFINGP